MCIRDRGTDKLTHTRGLELKNSCGDKIITVLWLHFERNLMKKKAERCRVCDVSLDNTR